MCLVCQHKVITEIEKQSTETFCICVIGLRIICRHFLVRIRQNQYLLSETMSGEAMEINPMHKINIKLKFLYRKNNFKTITEMPDFDYACSALYPNLTKKIKQIIQTNENKCMHFWLWLSHEEFQSLNC